MNTLNQGPNPKKGQTAQPMYLRVLLWLITRTLYRVKVSGPKRIPSVGGALLISNHLSFVDLLLIMSTTRRRIRFILPEEVCSISWLRPFLALLHVIPFPHQEHGREMDLAVAQAADAIRKGELVSIFAERSISRIGAMLPFRRDFERVMRKAEAPIVPVCIDGIWGSIFSYQGGRFVWKIPQRLPYPVSISFGEPMRSSSNTFQVTQAIRRLNTDSWALRRALMKPLGRTFVRTARSHFAKPFMADMIVPRLSAGAALARAIILARQLRTPCAGQKSIGVLMPPSVAAALVNLAILISGKVPVNLNYTLTAEALGSCIQQCELKTIITSRKFTQRLKTQLSTPTLLLEDIVAGIDWADRLMGVVLACIAPISLIEKYVGCAAPAGLDDLGTLIFSSGSTGDPKGVMLSHYNLLSNAQQLCQTLNFSVETRFLGVLPFFHSFGFTSTLVVPITTGMSVIYHPDPREAKAIGELVQNYRVDAFMATPAFLNIYLARVEPTHFRSLRFVLTGAEKMPDSLATDFEAKFGVQPVEGYGCTECSPAVAVNIPDVSSAGVRQVGQKRGSIGKPLPGMSIRIVDPDTGTDLPAGRPGLLLVRGPNVMQGYLNRPEKTAEVLSEGWYRTGDIASIDEDGFLQITDRLSRFSKIGGEMVPHIKVEEKLQQAAGTHNPVFVVTSVTDATKGERLVVLHTLDGPSLRNVLNQLPQLGLPNIWLPKPNQFFQINEIPLTGTGKLALQKVRQMAAQFSNTQATSEKERIIEHTT